MKRIFTISLLLLALFSQSLFGNSLKTIAIVRLIKTAQITSKDLDDAIKLAENMSRKKLSNEEEKAILDQLVNFELILQAAERKNIKVDDEQAKENAILTLSRQIGKRITEGEMKQLLRSRDVDYQNFLEQSRKQLVLRQFVQKEYSNDLKSVSQPTNQEIRDFYDEKPGNFVVPDRAHFEQVLVKTQGLDQQGQEQAKKRAEDIFDRIKKGEKLSDLAALYSEDQQSKNANGDVGFVPKNNANLIKIFGEGFFRKLFSSKVNELKFIKSNVGYHIVKVLEILPKKLLSLKDKVDPNSKETVEDTIKNLLYQQAQALKLQQLQKETVNNLKKEASVKIMDPQYK